MHTNYKIVLIGDSGVGKSSLVGYITNNRNINEMYPTVGAAYTTKDFIVGEQKIKINIWDTAGQERFKSLGPMYYKNTDACLAVFDVTNYESFQNVRTWIEEYKNINTNNKYVITLVANKCEIGVGKWKVPLSEIKSFASDYGYRYALTSCLTGKNVSSLFETLVGDIVELLPPNTKEAIDTINISNSTIFNRFTIGNNCEC